MLRRLLYVCILSLVFSGAWAKDPEAANREWVQRFYDQVLTNGKIELYEDFVAKDFREWEPLPGFSQDREGLKQYFMMMREVFPDMHYKVEFTVTESDRITVYVNMVGTHQKEFMGIPATGKKVKYTVIDIIKIVNGKMTDHWGVGDYLNLMEQLGAI